MDRRSFFLFPFVFVSWVQRSKPTQNGIICEIRIHDRALTDSEVKDIYLESANSPFK